MDALRSLSDMKNILFKNYFCLCSFLCTILCNNSIPTFHKSQERFGASTVADDYFILPLFY
jgi:hypothetical protein